MRLLPIISLKVYITEKIRSVVDRRTVNMTNICRDTEEGPMHIRLHPGAERYYVEHGYLHNH